MYGFGLNILTKKLTNTKLFPSKQTFFHQSLLRWLCMCAEYSGTSTQAQPTYVNMAELVSMAANRITNNLSTSLRGNNGSSENTTNNNSASTTPPQCFSAQPNSPVLSSTSASSLVSPDSTATNPISSPDAVSLAGGNQTSQNTPQNSSPQTPMAVVAGTEHLGDGDITPGYKTCSFSTTTVSSPTNTTTTTSTSNMTNTVVGVVVDKSQNSHLSQDEIDTKTVGSVLERANLFENLEKQQKQTEKPAAVRGESIYGRREEVYVKSTSTSERDSGKIKP